MQLWWVALGSLAVLALLAWYAALEIELDVRAVGHPTGDWAVGFGAALGVLAVAGAVARGVPTRVEVRVFGRRFEAARLRRWIEQRRARRPAPPPAPARSLGARLTAPELLDGLAIVARRVEVRALAIELDYGFRDVALTGRVLGVLLALSAVLPEKVTLAQRPIWQGDDAWQASVAGRVAVWPGLVLGGLVWYKLRQRFGHAPRPVEPARDHA